ncbi:MAG: bifunctional 4-hydroxy-2-oxoglutarate aldolase/2-dehydro-3-deoxy-phosphogluconate aldolase [Clostridia bacterium]|nr:bifunctional 4-hydroxy-2-oxoglutarate aldolase/2-dehydro-3-deoxy-phosphogluconate aldolase [Clostridia bacterium]
MKKLMERVQALGVLPVIKIQNADHAEKLAAALIAGGLPAAEVTFRTDAAEEAISRMHQAYPELLIGAGTVLTTEQADRAMAAGATFIVSPGLNPKVVGHCVEKGYPIIPGICTPSELECALGFGLEVVKFFPAEAAGGLPMIKAMSAPYGAVRFMPTGGINQKNILSYLANPKVLCCGGSWMVPEDKLMAEDFGAIEALVREAVELVKSGKGE